MATTKKNEVVEKEDPELLKNGGTVDKRIDRQATEVEVKELDDERANEQGERHHSLVEVAALDGSALRTLYDEYGNAVEAVVAARPTEQRYYDTNGYDVEPAKRSSELAPAWTDPREYAKQVERGWIVPEGEDS